jgi:ketosteroid isomerase-like protein
MPARCDLLNQTTAPIEKLVFFWRKRTKKTFISGAAAAGSRRERAMNVMRRFLTAFVLCHAVPAGAQPADIASVLNQSAADWSRGDLTGFMRFYEDSPDTEFITAAGPIHGYAAIRDHYLQKYGGTAHGLGQLGFSDLETRMLGPDYALTTGRFKLTRPASEGGDATGIFTLLFHRGRDGWRIAYDHTS